MSKRISLAEAAALLREQDNILILIVIFNSEKINPRNSKTSSTWSMIFPLMVSEG